MVATLLLAACRPDGFTTEVQLLARSGLSCGDFSQPATTGQPPLMLAAESQQGIGLWRYGDSEPLYRWNHRDDAPTIATACGLAGRARLALTASGDELVLWSTLDGRALRYWSAPATIHDLAISANGRYALLGLASGEAALFDIQQGGVMRVFPHEAAVTAVALSADDRLALTGSNDYSAKLWDLQNGQLLQQWQHQAPVSALAFSPDGQWVFTSARYDGGRVWEAASGALHWQLPASAASLKRGYRHTAARWSSNHRLLTASTDRRVQGWDRQQQRRLTNWQLPGRHPLRPGRATVLELAAAEAGAVYALTSDGYGYRIAEVMATD